MLNIGRLGPGGENYYLTHVASGAEDYYLARGEAPGRWIGRGAELLGLEGRVEAEPLRAVLAGCDPWDGEKLAGHPARKVPGFDLSFRPPKSVSLLWGLAGGSVAAEVREAHDAAVTETLAYLEREAGYTRRGAAGHEHLRVTGFVGAAFPHRTSRSGDPLLHTHVVVANLAQTVDDGVWRTLDSRRLYRHAKTAGLLYQAHLRHELTKRLGVEWGPVVNGHADLAGIPRPLIEAFSQRRAQILAALDERGEHSAKAAQVATLETRRSKELQASEPELRRTWVARAQGWGFDPASLDLLLYRMTDREHHVDLGALAETIAGDEGLTAHEATFARRDVVCAVAERLAAGAPVTEIEKLADALLQDERLVALGPVRGSLTALRPLEADEDGESRHTTRSLLAMEAHAIARALARRDEGVATVPTAGVGLLVRRHRELGADQRAMVERLTTSGDGVEVVVGKAGSGKTHALAVAHDAWQRGGVRVIGAALAARAARGLQEASGIPSTTFHRLLAACEDPALPGSPLPAGGVVVVDEAGMVGTRQLARLLHHAQTQGTKVVLVGDPAQLPEIEAGGLFRALCTRLDPIQLTHNRRQAERWEATTLDRLRDGDTRPALRAYLEHDRIVVTNRDQLHERLLADWKALADVHGLEGTVIVVRTHGEADRLNRLARQVLADTGRLGSEEVEVRGRSFAAGDRVVCLRNDRRLGIDNGTRATIAAIDPARREVLIRPDDRDQEITLPSSYLEAGHLTHAYAITAHKAQGLTVDHTLVVADESIDGEWGYVAMSRGRYTNRLYLAKHDEHPGHAPAPDFGPISQLAHRLRRTRSTPPLTEHEVYDEVETALRWQHLHQQLVEAATSARRHRSLITELQRLIAQRGRLLDTVDQVQERLDQTERGLARLTQRSQRDDLRQRLAVTRSEVDHVERKIVESERNLALLGEPLDLHSLRHEHAQLQATLDAVAADRARQLRRHPPGYITDLLGRRPEDPRQAGVWDNAVEVIARYRTRWLVDDPHHALGPQESNPNQQAHRSTTLSTLRDAAQRLHRLEPERGKGQGLGHDRGLGLA